MTLWFPIDFSSHTYKFFSCLLQFICVGVNFFPITRTCIWISFYFDFNLYMLRYVNICMFDSIPYLLSVWFQFIINAYACKYICVNLSLIEFCPCMCEALPNWFQSMYICEALPSWFPFAYICESPFIDFSSCIYIGESLLIGFSSFHMLRCLCLFQYIWPLISDQISG